MKYIENEILEHINALLNVQPSTSTSRLFGRLELYSCKNAAQDKLLLKHLDKKYKASPASVSPPTISAATNSSALVERKTLFYLRATMNAAFPDLDFSDIRNDAFIPCPNLSRVMNEINAALFSLDPNAYFSLLLNGSGDVIWQSLAEVMQAPLKECSVYAFSPSPDEFQEEQGTVWAFYYFFCKSPYVNPQSTRS